MRAYDSLITSALIKIKTDELKDIPSENEIDHDFSAAFENKMNKLISSVKPNGKSVSYRLTVARRAAAIILCLCLAAFTVTMSVPSARAAFLNVIAEFYENHIKFYFVTSETQMNDFESIYDVKADYIPNGFSLTNTSEEYEAVGYTYENGKNSKKFNIYVSLNDGLSVLTDKNSSDVEKINVNGKDAYLIYSKEQNEEYGTVIITGSKITVTIYGQLEKDELIKIAEGVS